jgi:transposase
VARARTGEAWCYRASVGTIAEAEHDASDRTGSTRMDTPEPPDALELTERNRRMVQDWRDGATITQIARRYGLSLNWTGTLLRQNGAELPETGRGIKRELDDKKVVADYVNGSTVRAIADAHEVSYGKIYRLLQHYRVPMRPRGGVPRTASARSRRNVNRQ